MFNNCFKDVDAEMVYTLNLPCLDGLHIEFAVFLAKARRQAAFVGRW